MILPRVGSVQLLTRDTEEQALSLALAIAIFLKHQEMELQGTSYREEE